MTFVPANVPPEAVHDVALVELQVSVEAPPLGTLVGFADSMTVGAGLAVTVTVAAAGALVPPAPVQVKEYVVVVVRAPVLWLPLVATVPVKVPPEAVHDVALVELQVSVAESALAIALGLASSVAVGTDAAESEVTTGAPDPQATRISAAPVAIIGFKKRIGILLSRIMFGSAPHQASSHGGIYVIHRSMGQGTLVNITRTLGPRT